MKMFKEFPYYIEKKLKHKLDVLVEQLDKNDVWIIVDGDEGSGKTNTATYLLYYFHCATGREFTMDRLYFDSDAMFEWVKVNTNGLLNWDEGALGGLSTEWWNRSQQNLIKFAMTGRKKHHVFIICIPKITKLIEYLRVDRSHALIHMDTGKNKKRYGKFMYITRRGKEVLNRLWVKKKVRLYGMCMRKYGGFGGYIPFVFNDLLDEKAYDKKKDEAIANIGNKKHSKDGQELRKLKGLIGKVKPPIKTLKELAEKLGVSDDTLRLWGKTLENEEAEARKGVHIINNGVKEEEIIANEAVID